jgi:hypothetical protein
MIAQHHKTTGGRKLYLIRMSIWGLFLRSEAATPGHIINWVNSRTIQGYSYHYQFQRGKE